MCIVTRIFRVQEAYRQEAGYMSNCIRIVCMVQSGCDISFTIQ